MRVLLCSTPACTGSVRWSWPWAISYIDFRVGRGVGSILFEEYWSTLGTGYESLLQQLYAAAPRSHLMHTLLLTEVFRHTLRATRVRITSKQSPRVCVAETHQMRVMPTAPESRNSGVRARIRRTLLAKSGRSHSRPLRPSCPWAADAMTSGATWAQACRDAGAAYLHTPQDLPLLRASRG